MAKLLLATYMAVVSFNGAGATTDIQAETSAVKAQAAHDRAVALAKELRRERMERIAERNLAEAMDADPEPSTVSYSGAPLCDSSCIECESGWDPQIWSSTGKYWGLYQFDSSTWYAHGAPAGTFGSASAELQHEIASRVTYDAWPNC